MGLRRPYMQPKSQDSASRVGVFLGAAGALILTSAIAVMLGDTVARFVPEVWLRRGAGALFLILGVLFLLGGSEANA